MLILVCLLLLLLWLLHFLDCFFRFLKLVLKLEELLVADMDEEMVQLRAGQKVVR